jgi:AraC-like DNA-binding protein
MRESSVQAWPTGTRVRRHAQRVGREPVSHVSERPVSNVDEGVNVRSERSPDSTVSMLIVRGLVEAVERLGVPGHQLLKAAQLAPELLEAGDTRMPIATIFQLCELATELTGNPAFGLHWAERIGEGTFLPVSPLIAHASTLRRGLDALSRFYPLLCDTPSFEFTEQGDTVALCVVGLSGDSARMQRFMSEMIVGGFYRIVRYFKPASRIESVSFSYPEPSYVEAYARVFDDLQRFDQPFTGMVFESAVLDRPAPHEDREIHEALESLAERRLLRVKNRFSYALRVREVLVNNGTPQRSDMETVARAMGLSVRSLRRSLEAEGTSFSGIVNELLAKTAQQLLQDEQRTIQEIAYEMGFSDASTFHRAFKSWTGMTPSTFRKAQR